MATHYSHILLATDLLDDNAVVMERAVELVKHYGSQLSALHVVESVPIYFGNELVLPEMQAIEMQLLEAAREKMGDVAQKLGIGVERCHVTVGMTKLEILSFAEKEKVDLIVMGSHSRHGLERLIGSTARTVLNSAPCDVLAVKIK